MSHSDDGKCLSCHTSLSYTITRPDYGESEELRMVRAAIEERVKAIGDNGQGMGWYRQFKEGSHGTEAIINSVSLISMDLAKGNTISPIAESSLKILWNNQLKEGALKGGFMWLEGFGLEPLESNKAGYWGSSLLLGMLSDVPGYLERPEVSENIKELRSYLVRNFDQQNLHNKLMAIEADKKLGSNLLDQNLVKDTLKKVLALREADGGWDLHKLVGKEGIGKSDSYATSVVLKALMTVNQTNSSEFKEGLTLLRNNQNLTHQFVNELPKNSCSSYIGAFFNGSVNKRGRTSLFMTDLATAFSLKTLTMAKKLGL